MHERTIAAPSAALHVFPSQYHVVEQHLRMPFVHWLPKNILRKAAIVFYVFLFAPSAVIIALEDPAHLSMPREHYAASVALFFVFGALFWWIFDGGGALRQRLTTMTTRSGSP